MLTQLVSERGTFPRKVFVKQDVTASMPCTFHQLNCLLVEKCHPSFQKGTLRHRPGFVLHGFVERIVNLMYY